MPKFCVTVDVKFGRGQITFDKIEATTEAEAMEIAKSGEAPYEVIECELDKINWPGAIVDEIEESEDGPDA